MNETFTGAAQVDADASPQADGAPSAARIVTGLSRLPGSFSGRYAARIVTGLRLDCPAPPRAATRPASSPGSGWIARLLLGPLRGPHRHRAQAGLPGSFSGRYAARIVTGLRLDCPAPSRAATRPASSPGSGWIARLLLGPLRGPHRHRAQAGLPGSSSGRYAARIVTGLKPGGALARGLAAAVVAAAAAYGCARRWWTVCPCAASDLGRRGAWSAGCRDRRQG
ncbi:glycosyl hydrolase [Mycobacterium tuberculosis variant bovis BCG]|nr:glycosyl hydrolase [Mycobacterium tuberculosis variant bovis BCG]